MKKRVILDVDGTLIPLPNYEEAVKATFIDLGIDYTSDDITNFINAMLSYEKHYDSYNYDNYLKHISFCMGFDLDKSILDNYLRHTERLVPKNTDVTIIETLEYLLSKEYELGVLSNFFKSFQEDRLNNLGYLRYFSFVIGGEEFMKPNEKAYYQAAGGLRKDNVIFIGDSRILDYEVPKSLGFNAILYDPNYQYSTKTLVNSFSDIRKVL